MKIHVLAAFGLAALVGCGQDASAPDESAPSGGQTVAPTAAAPAPAAQAAAARTAAPPGAMAYFISPSDGAVVSSPVRVVFGLKGVGVAPAGVIRADAGHHHLLVDAGLPDLNAPVPSDANHVHFGGGQTETEIALPPGRHTLQLLLGDATHVPHDPPVVSEQITIEVR